MRFLVESGTYRIDNVGDLAMLRRTALAVAGRFPGASIGVVTERPGAMMAVLGDVPGVRPVAASAWFLAHAVPVPRALERTAIAGRLRWRGRLLAGRFPRLARAGKRRDARLTAEQRAGADRFYDEVAAADAVVAAGGGYVTDDFSEHAGKVLATLNLAQGLGRPTAMFGQGLGPVSRHDLAWHGGRVMRRLDLLAVREPDGCPAVAADLGVPAGRVVMTGDDAVPLAAAVPVPPIRERCRVGVNVRLATSSDFPAGALPAIRGAVSSFAESRGADLLPLVVRTAESPENDVDAAALAFGTSGDALDRARSVRTPADATGDVARCRVVVTGAYHNAVFALAMGIPVVGLSRSAYYDAKLAGVARAFGTLGIGMTLLNADDADLGAKLSADLARLWDAAPSLADPLRASAAQQSAAGDAAYARFFDRVAASARGAA